MSLGPFSGLTEEELMELLGEHRILRMAADILRKYEQHDASRQCAALLALLSGGGK